MALNKWQTREAEKHAGENGQTLAESITELFPEEAPAARGGRKPAATKTPEKEPATA